LASFSPSSGLSPAVFYNKNFNHKKKDLNIKKELRSLKDLTKHLTARADDSHAIPVLFHIKNIIENVL